VSNAIQTDACALLPSDHRPPHRRTGREHRDPAHSTREIDSLISELHTMRDRLRVEREVVR
jgi:hypothetical protein